MILLNTPANNNAVVVKNISNLDLMQHYPVINQDEVYRLDDLRSDDEYWKTCLSNGNILFKKYFGDYRGTSSRRTDEILNSLDKLLPD